MNRASIFLRKTNFYKDNTYAKYFSTKKPDVDPSKAKLVEGSKKKDVKAADPTTKIKKSVSLKENVGVDTKKASIRQEPAKVIDDTKKSSGDKGGSSSTPVIPRPVRQQPAKVILGLIPVEWPALFYKTTGVTGFYTFMFTVGTYLVSKEKFVMEHNYYGGISMGILWYYGVTRLGPQLAKYLDQEIDNYEKGLNADRKEQVDGYEKAIQDELGLQSCVEAQLMLVEAKRENVHFQLEGEFRDRQMRVYSDVKRRLDYQVAVAEVQTVIATKNISDWVLNEVHKSLKTMNDDELIDHCINTLAALAPKKGPVVDKKE